MNSVLFSIHLLFSLILYANSQKTTTKVKKNDQITTQSTLNTETQKNDKISPITTSTIFDPTVSTNLNTTVTSTTSTTAELITNDYQKPSRPWDCSNFRFSYISKVCCIPPKFSMNNEAILKCKSKCEKEKSRHCCFTACKYQEMKIFIDNQIKPDAVLEAYLSQIVNETEKKLWENATKTSIQECIANQEPKTTKTSTISTTILLTKAKKSNKTKINDNLSSTTSTSISHKELMDKNIYCGIPVYVFLVISCIKVRNFINCPNFGHISACHEWRDYLMKCENELKVQF